MRRAEVEVTFAETDEDLERLKRIGREKSPELFRKLEKARRSFH